MEETPKKNERAEKEEETLNSTARVILRCIAY